MLLIVIFLCLVLSVFVALHRKDVFSLHLLGMSVSNLLMLSGVVVYIAKMGGVAAKEPVFLFLSVRIQRWLQYAPIPMEPLGYVVAVGRVLFPLSVLLLALEVTMIPAVRRRLKLLRTLALVAPALFLVYFWPDVFYTLVRDRFWLLRAMLPVSMGWILIYLGIAAVLLGLEYRAITIPYFKRNFRYLLLSVASISALYLLYATKDPAQIYNMFIGEYIRLGVTSYISPHLSGVGWLILGSCTLFFVILGGYGMIRYTQIDFAQSKDDMILERRFDAAGEGVSVFVHGIKNQLLASRVAHKKLSRALEKEPPDMEQVRACAGLLRELNEGMLTRMEELYRTFKTQALCLRPVTASQLADSAVKRFRGKYTDGEVTVTVRTDRLVLADLGALSEAVYNLLTNGYEAAVQNCREPEVELVVRDERLWTVLEVRDNGGGISKEAMGHIYDPFFTSKNTAYNWGMGLYYVRKIVKSHWGILRLETKPVEGSCFYILLPLFEGDAEQ